MQVFRFDPEVAWPVTDYGSNFRLSRLLWTRAGEVRVDCLFLGSGDRVGAHPTGLPQLFCVVGGEGWVQGAGTERVVVTPGRAAFWTAGEEGARGRDRWRHDGHRRPGRGPGSCGVALLGLNSGAG